MVFIYNKGRIIFSEKILPCFFALNTLNLYDMTIFALFGCTGFWYNLSRFVLRYGRTV